MRVPRDTAARRLADFLDACERRGLKMTHQRMEIYRELASSEEHPDADAIYRRVRKRTARAIADAPMEVKLRHIGNCLKADPAYGKGVAKALGISLGEVPK